MSGVDGQLLVARRLGTGPYFPQYIVALYTPILVILSALKLKLSRNEKILAITFAVMSVCGFLFTPAGLETRPLSALRSYALIPFFLSTTVLDVASLILIFKKPRIATITGVVGAISYIYLTPLDQAQLFFVGVSVPIAITINEMVALLASIVVLVFAPIVYMANRGPTKAAK